MTFSGANEELAKQIISFRPAPALKAALQFIIATSSFLPIVEHSKEVHTDVSGFKQLMAGCIKAFRSDRRLLGLVYKLYQQYPHISLTDEDWFKPFFDFFSAPCGTKTIFHKFYRYDKKGRELMSFADEACCVFLLNV